MKEYIHTNENSRKAENTMKIDIPKIFWKHFDLFRRGKLSLSDFSNLFGLAESELLRFLTNIQI